MRETAKRCRSLRAAKIGDERMFWRRAARSKRKRRSITPHRVWRRVPSGPKEGLRMLAAEEDLAFERITFTPSGATSRMTSEAIFRGDTMHAGLTARETTRLLQESFAPAS